MLLRSTAPSGGHDSATHSAINSGASSTNGSRGGGSSSSSSSPVLLNTCSSDALAELLRTLKRAFWPFSWECRCVCARVRVCVHSTYAHLPVYVHMCVYGLVESSFHLRAYWHAHGDAHWRIAAIFMHNVPLEARTCIGSQKQVHLVSWGLRGVGSCRPERDSLLLPVLLTHSLPASSACAPPSLLACIICLCSSLTPCLQHLPVLFTHYLPAPSACATHSPMLAASAYAPPSTFACITSLTAAMTTMKLEAATAMGASARSEAAAAMGASDYAFVV
eukprot:scaffold18676_cov21-Tisochrysis_lutea.AAC.3